MKRERVFSPAGPDRLEHVPHCAETHRIAHVPQSAVAERLGHRAIFVGRAVVQQRKLKIVERLGEHRLDAPARGGELVVQGMLIETSGARPVICCQWILRSGYRCFPTLAAVPAASPSGGEGRIQLPTSHSCWMTKSPSLMLVMPWPVLNRSQRPMLNPIALSQ